MIKCLGCIYFFGDDWDAPDPREDPYCHLYVFGKNEECDKEEAVETK